MPAVARPARPLPPNRLGSLDTDLDTVNEIIARRYAAALLATAVYAAMMACSKGSPPPRQQPTSTQAITTAKTDDSAAGSVDLGSNSYRPGTLSAVGSVAGTVKLDGAPPPDTTRVTVDQAICGTKTDPELTVSKGSAVSNAVVWIADVKTGKPLPVDKRAELSAQKCLLDPRVQAVVVGTTVNVFNDDRLLHRFVFIPLGTHDTLTVMPFFNVGQVVASERLAKTPQIVEIRCTRHPWTRGYIAVFDHPYFAVTDGDGNFKIDSLAPGTYKMMVWHEGMTQPAAQQVQVAANGTAKVDLAIHVAH